MDEPLNLQAGQLQRGRGYHREAQPMPQLMKRLGELVNVKTELADGTENPSEADLLFAQNARDACEIAELRARVEKAPQIAYEAFLAAMQGEACANPDDELYAHVYRRTAYQKRQVGCAAESARIAHLAADKAEAQLTFYAHQPVTLTGINTEDLPEPGQARAYLESHGWTHKIWSKGCLIGYLRPGAFGVRLSNIIQGLQTIARFEKRSPLEILWEMKGMEVEDGK